MWRAPLRTIPLFAALAVFTLAALAITPRAAAQSTGSASHPVVDQVTNAAAETMQAALREFVSVFNDITGTPRPLLLRALMIVCGAALVLAGWRMSDTALVVVGFAAGAALIALYLSRGGGAVTVTAMFLGGIIGAGLSFVVFYVALFALGAYLGAALTLLAATLLGLLPITLLGLGIGAIAGGLLALSLRTALLVALAAGAGGLMLSLGLNLSLNWAILFALAGLLAQIGLSSVYPTRTPAPA